MTRGLPIPPAVRARHLDWTAEMVYSQSPQVATWRLARGSETRFVKVAVEGWGPSLSAERARLEWALSRLPVPHVLDGGVDDGVEWLLVGGLPGRDATVHALRRDPATLVPILARGLRAFHETRSDDCPFDFTLDAALGLARQRVEDGLVIPVTDFHAEHRHLTPQEALDHLESNRPDTDDHVLCHGDYCLPNVLIDDAGGVAGYVDLGDLGVADRWWDLAVATWSVTWNLGHGWEGSFLDTYGIELDPERSAYYRLMYDMVS